VAVAVVFVLFRSFIAPLMINFELLQIFQAIMVWVSVPEAMDQG
jgi:hypothetical protein